MKLHQYNIIEVGLNQQREVIGQQPGRSPMDALEHFVALYRNLDFIWGDDYCALIEGYETRYYAEL